MRILWLKTELLHPVDRGGAIRTYHMLKELKRSHHITYLTLDDGQAAQDARERAYEYCHDLICIPRPVPAKFSAGFYAGLAVNLASPLPYFIHKYKSPPMRQAIAERVRSKKVDLLICDFLMPSVNVPDGLDCPTALFQHNVEAMIRRRQCEVQTSALKRAFLRGQWLKSVAYERAACRRFDQVIAVSAQDRELMEREYGLEGVAEVPTGVDTQFFQPSGKVRQEPLHLVFTGAMDWLPNEDGIHYFTEHILPLVRQRVPAVKLTVVGRKPYPNLVELSRRDPAITVTGRVEDVRPYVERASAYIVPLRVGGGTRLKIFEAMAMEKPVVSTSIGAEGLPVRDGQDLLLADTPEAFADALARVLTDQALAHRMGASAATLVRERFSWNRVTAQFADICQRVAAGKTSRVRKEEAPASLGARV